MNTIVEKIDKNGYVSIPDLINSTELNQLQNLVDERITNYGNRNFWLNEDLLKKTFINDNHFINKIEKIIKDLTISYGYNDLEERKLYKILRVIQGSQEKNERHLYHYDAHLITLLIPIYIPKKESSGNGDLILFPNTRKITKSIIVNIIQKLIYQNFIFRKLLQINLIKKIFKYQRLKLEPGKVYIFNGFRTLHGNLDIHKDDKRATLLIHFYDLFKDSYLVKLNRKNRIKKETNKLN